MREALFIYTTVATVADAQKLAQELLEQQLIACANIIPVNSCYVWEGKQANDNECGIVFKTLPEMGHLVEQALAKIHPYKVPCITAFPVRVNDKFAAWIEESVKK